MQIVIDIPEEIYKEYSNINWANMRPDTVDEIECAISHGIPLDDILSEIQDIYVGYRHGYEIMADVLAVLDKHIGERSDKE